uniref:CCHC-type domain-containing protein n=1 Tax=Chenopodium quinoa TaxID=63459 RepID=A0A803N8V9_CHEQI
MNYNENIRHYVHHLNLGIEHFHYNILGGQSDYLTPERRSQILLHTLIGKGPYPQLTKKYVDLYINGKPNDKYYYDEQWIPTVDYLEKAMMEAKRDFDYNLDDEEEDEPQESEARESQGENTVMKLCILCMQNYHVYTMSRWRRIAQMAETPKQLAARHKRKGNGESSSNPQGYDKRPRLVGNSNGNGGNGQQEGRNNNNQSNNHRGQGQQNQQGSRNRPCRKCDKSHPGRNCNEDLLTCFECGEVGHKKFECPKKQNGNNQAQNGKGNNNGNKGGYLGELAWLSTPELQRKLSHVNHVTYL